MRRAGKPAHSPLGQQRLAQYEQHLYTVEDLTAVRLSRREVLVGMTGLVVAVLAGGGLALLTQSKRPTSPSHTLVPLQKSTPYFLGTYLYTTYRNHHDEVRNVSWSHKANVSPRQVPTIQCSYGMQTLAGTSSSIRAILDR